MCIGRWTLPRLGHWVAKSSNGSRHGAECAADTQLLAFCTATIWISRRTSSKIDSCRGACRALSMASSVGPLSIYLSVCLSIYLSIYLSVCLSIKTQGGRSFYTALQDQICQRNSISAIHNGTKMVPPRSNSLRTPMSSYTPRKAWAKMATVYKITVHFHL